jgi:hypothetical protein
MRMRRLLPDDAVMIPAYRHVDMVTGAAERPDRGHEPVAADIAAFVALQVG